MPYGLETFLKAYQAGKRGLQLYNVLKGLEKARTLPANVVSETFRLYKSIAESAERYNQSSPPNKLSDDDITRNPHFGYRDMVKDRFSYIVRVSGHVGGESVIHDRFITVRSSVQIEMGELVNRLANEFAYTFYSQRGMLAAHDPRGVEITSTEVVGVSRLY